jgi:transposase
MLTVAQNSPEKAQKQIDQVADLKHLVERLTEDNRILQEKVNYLLQQRFGAKTESVNPNQLSLFDILERPPIVESEPELIDIPQHKRTRKGRSIPSKALPRVIVEHDLTDAEKQCHCGACLNRIGEETSEQYDVIPAKFQVIRNVRFKYACSRCQTGLKTATLPPAPLPRTQASPGLLAWLGTGKFVDGLPIYRQTKILDQRFGITLTTTTLNQWMILSAMKILKPLVLAMAYELKKSDDWHMDETRLQVLAESDRTAHQLSWLWIRMSGTGTPVVLFDYSTGRSAAVAKALTTDFKGWLHCDGLASYDAIATECLILVACWVHARRKFKAVIKAAGKNGKPSPLAVQALNYIQRLYQLDNATADDPPEKRYRHRQQHLVPFLKEFRLWLEQNLEKGLIHDDLLSTAFIYLYRQWDKLTRFVDDGRLKLDNNTAEGHIRPIALGRKNWLFCRSEAGATSTALWYSVVETAKANGWEPYHYLRMIFSQVPIYLQEGKSLEPLMPWNIPPTIDA